MARLAAYAHIGMASAQPLFPPPLPLWRSSWRSGAPWLAGVDSSPSGRAAAFPGPPLASSDLLQRTTYVVLFYSDTVSVTPMHLLQSKLVDQLTISTRDLRLLKMNKWYDYTSKVGVIATNTNKYHAYMHKIGRLFIKW